jgi:hypothetical protein
MLEKIIGAMPGFMRRIVVRPYEVRGKYGIGLTQADIKRFYERPCGAQENPTPPYRPGQSP